MVKEARDVEVKCELCGNILALNTHNNRFGQCECGNSKVEVLLSFIQWEVPKELKGKGDLYSEYGSSKCYYLDEPNLTDEELKMLDYILNSKSTMTDFMSVENTREIYVHYGQTKEDKFIKFIQYSAYISNFKSYNYTGVDLKVNFTENYSQKLLSFYRLCRMADKNNMRLKNYIEMLLRKNQNILPNCYTDTVEVLDFKICL